MTTLVNTFKVKESENNNIFYVLEERKGFENKTIWVMFCENNGVEMNDTREVRRRLNKETREFFKVK